MRQPGRCVRLILIIIPTLLMVIVLSACGGKEPPASTPPPATVVARPEKSAAVVIDPQEGGVVGLSGGAEIVAPPGSLTDVTLVTLAISNEPPEAAIPRSIVGQAYQLSLEGGAFSGLATLQLPLPRGIAPDQYDLSAYQWNGSAWKRLGGHFQEGTIQIGVKEPAIFAILGEWRMADASMVTSKLTAEAGQATVPIEVRGQYRHDAPPNTQHDYVEARLQLKRDTSGGAGQVSGNTALDETIDEAVLWFQPDPTRAQGLIEFSHVFDVMPGSLAAPLGSTTYFYAVLTVDDSAAPTRRLSTGVDHTHLLPILVRGSDVVRPELTRSEDPSLRWHVRLDEQTLFTRPAEEQTLSLADALAQGGLGEYRITLESEANGAYQPVSNEVTVVLTLPTTDTPAPSPAPGLIARATPVANGTASPVATVPPTPTRRTPPSGRTPTPTIEVSPTITEVNVLPTATQPPWASVFWADRYVIAPQECATLQWNVQDVTSVFLDGNPTTGTNSTQVCPAETAVYSLRTFSTTGNREYRVTIQVDGSAPPEAFTFSADAYQLTEGSCTMLHWQVPSAIAVYLNGEGVAGEATREVCPTEDTDFELRIDSANGTTTRRLSISVIPAGVIPIKFWADQYTMDLGSCTTLRWSVDGVEGVYLSHNGTEEGVAGIGTRENVCPSGRQVYALRAVAGEDRSGSKQITIWGGSPTLSGADVVAQAMVLNVKDVADLDPASEGAVPGWEIELDGTHVLYKGATDCCAPRTVLQVTQAQASGAYVDVDWPVRSGQAIEFRALCNDQVCRFSSGYDFYLRMRSE